jgi:thiol-disulfide isomerase/thioredoxin
MTSRTPPSRDAGLHQAPRIRSRPALGLALALVSLASVGIAWAEADRAPSRIDRPAGTGSPILGEDGEIDLARRAGRLTILHFWASWCEPCKAELPALASFYEGPYRRLADQGVVLLTISLDVRRADLERFLRGRSFEFPIFLDSLGELQQQVGLWGLPGTVLIGSDLEVVERMIGPQDWESRGFLEAIEVHLEKNAVRSRDAARDAERTDKEERT